MRHLTLHSGFPDYIFEKHLLECVFHLLDPEWRPSRGLVHTAEDPHPHIMFTMVHDTKGNEKLLRGEVFAILVTIKTQLTILWLKDHFIIPVCSHLLSFVFFYTDS